MSRYKIVDHTPKKWGVKIELPSGRDVWVFNAISLMRRTSRTNY